MMIQEKLMKLCREKDINTTGKEKYLGKNYSTFEYENVDNIVDITGRIICANPARQNYL